MCRARARLGLSSPVVERLDVDDGVGHQLVQRRPLGQQADEGARRVSRQEGAVRRVGACGQELGRRPQPHDERARVGQGGPVLGRGDHAATGGEHEGRRTAQQVGQHLGLDGAEHRLALVPRRASGWCIPPAARPARRRRRTGAAAPWRGGARPCSCRRPSGRRAPRGGEGHPSPHLAVPAGHAGAAVVACRRGLPGHATTIPAPASAAGTRSAVTAGRPPWRA